jgi:hypothetical protein
MSTNQLRTLLTSLNSIIRSSDETSKKYRMQKAEIEKVLNAQMKALVKPPVKAPANPPANPPTMSVNLS